MLRFLNWALRTITTGTSANCFLTNIIILKNAKCHDTLFRDITRMRLQREKARKRNVPSLRVWLSSRMRWIFLPLKLHCFKDQTWKLQHINQFFNFGRLFNIFNLTLDFMLFWIGVYLELFCTDDACWLFWYV